MPKTAEEKVKESCARLGLKVHALTLTLDKWSINVQGPQDSVPRMVTADCSNNLIFELEEIYEKRAA